MLEKGSCSLDERQEPVYSELVKSPTIILILILQTQMIIIQRAFSRDKLDV